MNTSTRSVFTGLCAFFALAAGAVPLSAQMTEVKEKPAMYSYVANWQVPRAHWAEFEKANDADKQVMEKALANGTIVGYGGDENLVHQPDAETHDDWWSATSLAGLVKVLDLLSASGSSSSSVLSIATKHWDSIYVSHYYNWKPGAFKGGYTHASEYKLKADAPDDAVDLLAKHLVVTVLDKLVADGTVTEYEIDEAAIHTSAPGVFLIVYITPTPEGLDTVQGAVRESLKAHPLSGDAFGSFVDDSGHRDELLKSNGIFK